jgi:predicted ATPase
LTSFIGRDALVADVLRRLKSPATRLVTLTGPGGVGKTRVATAVALAYQDRAVFVELAPISAPAFVPVAMADAIGLRNRSGEPAARALLAELRERRLLVVLDNFEHVISAASFVSELLRACPGVKILVTSRSVLRLGGEQIVPVSPLDLPAEDGEGGVSESPAVQLFVERAIAVFPHFALTPENMPAVAEICRSLDGLPLAIELAAARSNLLAPKEILRRLDSRLSILRGGPRDQPARLQSMTDAVNWSVDLLPAEQRELFAQLAVFRGGMSIEAIEAISGDPAVLERIGGIVDQSLVQVRIETDTAARFGMLETIRETALQLLLDSGTVGACRERHARYFLELSERADGELWTPRQGRWLQQLNLEQDNLRAAIDWLEASNQVEALVRIAGALGGFWLFRGYVIEARAILERALCAAESVDVAPSVLARAQFRLASLLAEQGEYETAKSLLARCAEIHTALDDQIGLAHVSSWLGAIAEYEHDEDQAFFHYTQATGFFRQTGDSALISYGTTNLADTAFRRGDIQRSRELAIEAIAAARDADDPLTIILTLGVVGQAELAVIHPEAARLAFDESLTLALQTGYQAGIANSLAGLAAVAMVAGAAETAAGLLGAADSIRKRAGLHKLLNQAMYAQTRTSAETELGRDRFSNLWVDGAMWPIEWAAEIARGIRTT